MSFVHIRDLQPFQFNKKIKVRVCRIWRPKLIGYDDQFGGLQCILVDQMADAIQATVKEIDYDLIGAKIKAGCIYEITHFHSGRSKTSHKVVPHAAHLFFNTRTVFTELSSVYPQIPRHRFYFLDYGQLCTRIDKNEILTDVLGHITAVQPLEEKMVGNGRLETKCEIYIQNIRKEDVRITLWGDTARAFDFQALEELAPPIITVFTSLKVKQFQGKTVLNSSVSTMIFIDPDIQELDTYKMTFGAFVDAIKMVPPSSIQPIKPEELENAKKLSVQELNVLDPDLCKDAFILCRAAITRFNTRSGWWYKACPSCFKQLRSIAHNDELLCPKHNNQIPLPWFKVGLVLEDSTDETNAMIIGKAAEQLFGISCNELVIQQGYTDQQEFPHAILQTRGQFKIFQLRFGSIKTDSNRNDLLIQAVFDEKVQLLESGSEANFDEHQKKNIAAQMLPPTPPLLSKKTPPVSLAVSSNPSSVEPISNSKKKRKLQVKRALLTSLTSKKLKSDVEAENKSEKTVAVQTREENVSAFDNLPIIDLKKKTVQGSSETTSPTPTSEAKTSKKEKKEH
ncbi:unnamed protein product [Prunus armeniaca]